MFLEFIMMVIEYVPYGDLLGYLRESRGLKDKFYYHCEELPCQEEVSPYELFSFAKQIACGMCFLAEKKVGGDRRFVRTAHSYWVFQCGRYLLGHHNPTKYITLKPCCV
jgi:hypothetical protein